MMTKNVAVCFALLPSTELFQSKASLCDNFFLKVVANNLYKVRTE